MGAAGRAADDVALRPMVAEDLPQVLEIEQDSFPAPWPRSAFDLACRASDLLSLVACRDTVVGYVIGCAQADTVLIANIAVAAEARRAGIGGRLLRRALEWAEGQGATRCLLDVRISNRGAQEMYRHHGFAPVGIRRRYYLNPPEDALTMLKELEAEAFDAPRAGQARRTRP